MIVAVRARRVEDILAGFGDVSKKPADLGSIPSESVLQLVLFSGYRLLTLKALWF